MRLATVEAPLMVAASLFTACGAAFAAGTGALLYPAGTSGRWVSIARCFNYNSNTEQAWST